MIPSQLLSLIANHLWQSTVFSAVAGLLTLALRNNRAQTRYWVWLAASMKFLLPFSLLVGLGSYLGARHTPSPIPPAGLSSVIELASQPFTVPTPPPGIQVVAATSLVNWIPAVLCALWMIGSATIIFSWWLRWRGLRAALRTASPLDLHIGVKAVVSPAFAEPGVFGVRQPVLLLPAGITERLTPPQLQAILAHELCHVRRRDNLASALHMAVEALFWFHPLVWWLGARMMEERERACDEEVLLIGSEPVAYAAGILKICELYLESSLPCVSGVTGANLRKRIEAIMSGRTALPLTAAKKAALAAAAVAAVIVPLAVGVLHAPAIQAQPPAVSAKFEVVSIKTCLGGEVIGAPIGRGPGGGTGGARGNIRWDPERLHEQCQPLHNLIRDAYLAYPDGKPWTAGWRAQPSADAIGLQGGRVPPISERLLYQEIQDIPAWANSDRYTIDAKAEHPASPEMMQGPMMQALLEDRFKLKIHRESRDRPVYELRVAEGGTRLQPSREGSCLTIAEARKQAPGARAGLALAQPVCGLVFSRNGRADFPGTTMAGFARNLSFGLLDRDVIDKTGIAGFYDVHLEVAPVWLPADDSQPRDDGALPPPTYQIDRAATARAFQSALLKVGLKLEATKGAGVFLVIDHVERPTAN
jgi:bla regulator protein blaR1